MATDEHISGYRQDLALSTLGPVPYKWNEECVLSFQFFLGYVGTMAGVRSLLIFHLVTRVCLTGGILTTKAPWDSEPVTSLQLPRHGYLPAIASAFPKVSQAPSEANVAANGNLKADPSTGKRIAERSSHAGYTYEKPTAIEFQLPLRDQTTKSHSNHQREPMYREIGKTIINVGESCQYRSRSYTSRTYKEVRVTHGGGPSRTPKTLTSTARPGTEVDRHPHVPRRSSYQVAEEHDEYLTDNSDGGGLPHRGKVRTTYPHRDSQDITTAIKALDHFLSGALNGDGYNSELHPPPNPVLALVLSRYGRYVPGARNPRVYAYMAVNNVHNHRPFGKYKEEREEESGYVLR